MSMLEQPEFGRRVKAMRIALGLSQAAVAGDGMSTGYLSRLESGARPPTKRAVAYLAERLEASPADFAEPLPTGRSEATSLAHALAAAVSGDSQDIAALEELLTEDDGTDAALCWQAHWMLADLKDQQGHHTAESAHLQRLTTLSDEIGHPALRVRARTRLARCRRTLGDTEQARTLAAEAVSIARAHGLSTQDTAGALLVLVSAEVETSRLPDARAHTSELCDLVADVPGTLHVKALWTAATVHLHQADHPEAQRYLAQALERLDSHDDLELWMCLRLAAASLSLQLQPPQTEAAAGLLDEAEPAVALVGTRKHHQELQAVRAHLAFHQGRTRDARELCDQARADEPLLAFRDRTRLEALHNQLLLEEGCDAEGTAGLRALAQQAHETANIDLAAEIWRILAESLATRTDADPLAAGPA